jgi:glucose/arabinose dehydrogenase
VIRRAPLLLVLLLCACTAGTTTPGALTEQRSPDLPWPVQLPPGFAIDLYARDLGEVRSLVFGPNGTPYVTIMRRSRPGQGQVLALPDANADGKADRPVVVAEGLDRPHGLLFHNGELYASDSTRVLRLRDTDGDLVADAQDVLVSGLPNRGDHWSRPFVFDQDGALLVMVGSSCNACQEGDKRQTSGRSRTRVGCGAWWA